MSYAVWHFEQDDFMDLSRRRCWLSFVETRWAFQAVFGEGEGQGQMGAVRITSLNPKFNRSHFDLPPSSIHRMTGWVANSRILWRMRTAPISWHPGNKQSSFFVSVHVLVMYTCSTLQFNFNLKKQCWTPKSNNNWRWADVYISDQGVGNNNKKKNKKKLLVRWFVTYLVVNAHPHHTTHSWSNVEELLAQIFRGFFFFVFSVAICPLWPWCVTSI